MESKREALLLGRLRQGDEDALAQIIEGYTAYVGAVVWGILEGRGSREEARDLVSEVFYSLWQNAGKVRDGKLKAYLGTIARHKAINALRKGRVELELEDETLHLAVPGPEDEAMRQAEYRALREALDAMGEPDRSIFLRHYYLCQSAAQIEQSMGINRNTVHTKLRRGRERLRQALEEGGFIVG